MNMMEICKRYYNVFDGKKLDANFLSVKNITLHYDKHTCVLPNMGFPGNYLNECMEFYTIDVKPIFDNTIFNISVTVYLNINRLKLALNNNSLKPVIKFSIFKFLIYVLVPDIDYSGNIMNNIMQKPVEYIDSQFDVTLPMNVKPYIYQKKILNGC